MDADIIVYSRCFSAFHAIGPSGNMAPPRARDKAPTYVRLAGRRPAGRIEVPVLVFYSPLDYTTLPRLGGRRGETCKMITAHDGQTLPRRDMDSWIYRRSRLPGLFCQSVTLVRSISTKLLVLGIHLQLCGYQGHLLSTSRVF
ncbi:hypothetical protein TESG_07872 [Trichophyton tonsurans CBS 112818]|uniref:Uncharacterized protein n=1 Tax=Trichophyton tonsurans (strain CBS 112818) TaxID=647933 RepID=F2SAE3_TRIT1|nr:hypothetical protein TESG_07872 [Trichophyton tonsurans CBS 112818]